MDNQPRRLSIRSNNAAIFRVCIVQFCALAMLGVPVHVDVRYRKPVELSEREIDVLRLVAQGCSDQDIAQQLNLSRRAASNHVATIRQKFRANSRSTAAMVGVRLGLFSVGQNDASSGNAVNTKVEDGIGPE